MPFVDATLLERLGPAIASDAPPNKQDLAACAQRLPQTMSRRPKTGFTTPVREWIERSSRHFGARAARMGSQRASNISPVALDAEPQALSVAAE